MPTAGFRLVCASESGKPDSDAHTNPPDHFRPRETPQIRPGTSQTGDIAANTRNLTTNPRKNQIV